jgi:hypothetical protein
MRRAGRLLRRYHHFRYSAGSSLRRSLMQAETLSARPSNHRVNSSHSSRRRARAGNVVATSKARLLAEAGRNLLVKTVPRCQRDTGKIGPATLRSTLSCNPPRDGNCPPEADWIAVASLPDSRAFANLANDCSTFDCLRRAAPSVSGLRQSFRHRSSSEWRSLSRPALGHSISQVATGSRPARRWRDRKPFPVSSRCENGIR